MVQTFAAEAGRNGNDSEVTMWISSAVVQRTVALRDCSASELPRAQGCSLVRYLSAAAITVQMVSRARAKLSLSKFSRTSPIAAWGSFARALSCGFNAAGLGIFAAKVFSVSPAGPSGTVPRSVAWRVLVQ